MRGKHDNIRGAQPIIFGQVCGEETPFIINHKVNEVQ
jgi:hypothetical protein